MGLANRSNAWGWFGLILSVSLIGAGILYQREGGKLFPWLANAPPDIVPLDVNQPPAEPRSVPTADQNDSGSQTIAGQQPGQGEPPATGNSVDSGTTAKSLPKTNSSTRKVGTLKFQIVNSTSRLTSPGPWIYVDRKLRWTCTDPAAAGTTVTEGSLEFDPGTYNIECVATRGSPDLVNGAETLFVLHSRRPELQAVGGLLPHVEIRAGEETHVSFYLGVSCLNSLSPNDLSIALPPGPRFAEPDANSVRDLQENADRKIQLFESDALTRELTQLQDKWRSESNWPKKPVVVLNIPDSYGGPREVDATQVRLMVDWLKWRHWKDFPTGYNFEVVIQSAQGLEAKRQLDTVFDLVKQYQSKIDNLKGIASRLEEAKR